MGECRFLVAGFYSNSGRDPFNQNFRKFRSKTQWISSAQPEKFGKNGSTFWGGPLFPIGPVGILVEWIAPSNSPFASEFQGFYCRRIRRNMDTSGVGSWQKRFKIHVSVYCAVWAACVCCIFSHHVLNFLATAILNNYKKGYKWKSFARRHHAEHT